MKLFSRLMIIASLFFAVSAFAIDYDRLVANGTKAITEREIHEAPSEGVISVAFGPNGETEKLMLQVIDKSNSSIDMTATSLKNKDIVQHLLQAQRRRVSVRIVVDPTVNSAADETAKYLQALKSVGAAVRVAKVSENFLLTDSINVATSSSDNEKSVASRNSVNVMVNWNNMKLSLYYGRHFDYIYSNSKPI